MQRSFDPSSVVVAKMANVFNHVCDLFPVDLNVAERSLLIGEARFWDSSKIKNYLDKLSNVFSCS
jgi:hypothetical protein